MRVLMYPYSFLSSKLRTFLAILMFKNWEKNINEAKIPMYGCKKAEIEILENFNKPFRISIWNDKFGLAK